MLVCVREVFSRGALLGATRSESFGVVWAFCTVSSSAEIVGRIVNLRRLWLLEADAVEG